MKITIKERDPEPIENIFHVGNIVRTIANDSGDPPEILLVTYHAAGLCDKSRFIGLNLSVHDGIGGMPVTSRSKAKFEQFHGTITLEAGS